MKTLFITLISFISLASIAQAQTTTADEGAIKKVITDETDAFFTKNRDKWASYWVHEPYINWTAQGGANQVLTQSGWEAYSGMFDGHFNSPSTGPAPTFIRDKFQVSVLDKVATATFQQTRQRADGGKLVSREVRVLEKQGTDWKLVYVHSRNVE
jgi:hypothetical protein